MDDIVCEICVKDYNIDVTVPHVLSCGHTICAYCITQILQTSGSCPRCWKAMTCCSSSDCPINYSLLGMVDSLKNDSIHSTLQTFLQRRLNILKRKYVSLESKLTGAKINLENNLEVIAASLAKIQELKIDDSIDVESCNQTILTINKKLEDLRNGNTLNYAKRKSSTALNCCDFHEPIEFISEIYKRVSNQEVFYAVTTIDDEAKFSLISVWGNKLVLHAFGPPVEDPSIKTVWFQEIKNCLTTDVRALLEICSNDTGIRQIIVIKTISSSLVPQFLKFCTGEIGPLYKGATYYQDSDLTTNAPSVLTVNTCNVNGVEEDGNFEYFSTLGTSGTYTPNELIVIGKRNGGFQIVRLRKQFATTDAIGKIEEPLQLQQLISHGNNGKVTDSGIIIQL